MTTVDNRTAKQRQTHVYAVVARDRVLSGWGGATGGASRVAWVCDPAVNIDRVFNWVKSRRDLERPAIVDLRTYRVPRGTAHFKIAVCNPGHPATKF